MSNTIECSDICPRCEEGILVTSRTFQDISVADTIIRVPDVQTEECRHCGFRSISGKEVALFELLFAPQYARSADLISALRSAGFHEVFLKENRTESVLSFGPRDYVSGLTEDLRGFYLDNESRHIIENLNACRSSAAPLEAAERRFTLKLPKLGEGENGVVYEYQEDHRTVLKLAKPRPYSRNHLREEYELTNIFMRKGIPVPKIVESDIYGSFMVKEKLAGESLAKIYHDLGGPSSPRHHQVRSAVKAFIERLFSLFMEHPEAKTSISPNNIFVLLSGESCQCLLVDTGPAPLHDYSTFDFSNYWQTVIPHKIEQYRAVGYI